jgi:phage-related protein
VGFELYRVQLGLNPYDWKPMSTVGAGVREIRVHVGREFRVLYIANRPEAVYVLHAFAKTSQRTARRDLQVAKQRLALVLNVRLVP